MSFMVSRELVLQYKCPCMAFAGTLLHFIQESLLLLKRNTKS